MMWWTGSWQADSVISGGNAAHCIMLGSKLFAPLPLAEFPNVPHLNWLEDLRGQSMGWKVESFQHVNDFGEPQPFALKHFRGAERVFRPAEYVFGKIAHELQIGAPAIELLTIDEEFIREHSVLRTPPALIQYAELGRHVGIEWVENTGTMIRFPEPWKLLADQRQPAEIVACDVLSQNAERHADDVLVKIQSRGGRGSFVLVPIDWAGGMNLFSIGTAEWLKARDTDEIRRYVYSGLAPAIRSADDFRSFLLRLSEWAESPARIRSLIAWLPEEWHVSAADRAALVEYVLHRIRIVLERLSRTDDTERAFPGWQATLPIR